MVSTLFTLLNLRNSNETILCPIQGARFLSLQKDLICIKFSNEIQSDYYEFEATAAFNKFGI